MMKAIEKRGKEKGWVYDKGWENILKSRGFSPVHLDEHIEMDEQGNPVFCYIQDERGFVSFLINPDAPKTVIHNALDSILDDLSKTKTDKRFRQEKNGALDVWGERRKRKSVNLKKLVVGRR